MRRLLALIGKEMLQIMRDPSAILIAFVLPLVLLFIFGYGVNLDSNRIRIGVVLEDMSPSISSLVETFTSSRFLEVEIGHDRREFEPQLVAGEIRGIVVVPQNLVADAILDGRSASIQVIADGSEPNIASFVQNYVNGVYLVWLDHQIRDRGIDLTPSLIRLDNRFWFNPELRSRNFLIPGSIAIIMTLIGTLLTALVIAREWERGTMEALMATPVSISQILLGKLIPYYLLGMGSMVVCWVVATFWYEVPFRGSFLALTAATSVFLLGALGQGLLISSVAKDQFVASQMALMSAFLPAFMLSGFIFEISSMPLPVRILSHVFAARYFVTSLQTLFLSGNIWPLLLSCMGVMVFIGLVFFVLTARKTVKRLDV
ncbi:ABC transporter permease [Gynuella sunshinyii]|uniref:ABC-type multidrug transport system, permease component n=1 Tax=Gynuella sunshinyii YC6258 TaxID=1445510 RepID=A0A0C5VD04_9GAMM|nr:ABC transporter permease [Gynuella sunshinyii]AJQ92397.1 ABC-type multidrug transport system, permease component [Gynuella sunshinyii YC6258]